MKKPDITVFYEQSKAKRALLEHCEMSEETRKALTKPDWLQPAAEAGDVERLLTLLDNTAELAFVVDNIAWLKAPGKY